MNIALEFAKYRVPLSKAWESVTSNILNHTQRDEVETHVKSEINRLDMIVSGTEYVVSVTESQLLQTARDEVLAAIQQRFSGVLPDLPDRETDVLTQHSSIWSLVGKLLQSGNRNSEFSNWCVEYAADFLKLGMDDASDNHTWKSCGRNVLNAISSIKGVVDQRIVDICQTEQFLSDRELMTPSIKILTRSDQFKKLMSSPDMVTDGDKTLPKLLLELAGDRDFKKTFTWLPLDPFSPLTRSGGNGVMPTDQNDYRFIVSIILKVLFGKLRQRGGGIDRRTSMAERQHQIMGYIGTIPIHEMDLVFEIFFARILDEKFVKSSLRKLSGICFESDQFILDNTPLIRKESLVNNTKLQQGVLQSIHFMVHQMKRKIDDFVPLLVAIVVSLIKWSSPDSLVFRPALARLNELMSAYAHIGWEQWLSFLEPIGEELESSLTRSSTSQISSVFKLVTSWCYSESLSPLYTTSLGKQLLEKLFVPSRQLVDKPADIYLRLVLILAGVDPSEDDQTIGGRNKSYKQSRVDAMRASRKRGGDDDSGDDEDDEYMDNDVSSNTLPVFVSGGIDIISNYLEHILGTITMSFVTGESGKNLLQLRATIALCKLASSNQIVIPDDRAKQLLELMGEFVGPYGGSKLLKKRKSSASKNLLVLLNTITELVKVSSESVVPKSLLISCARLVATLDDVEGRLVLSQCLVEISRKIDPSETVWSETLVRLNAIRRTSASVQPDVDSHVEVLQDLLDTISKSRKDVFSLHIVRHCLFLISSSACDTTVRHCAERFLSSACMPLSDGSISTVRVTMIVNSIHRLIALHAFEGPLKSGLKILIQIVRDVAPLVSGELRDRLHADLIPFVQLKIDETTGIASPSVMEDLLHIQKLKRGRALKKLVESAQTDLTPYTISKLIVPLGLDAVIQPAVLKSAYDSGLCDLGIRALEIAPNPLDVVIDLLRVYLRKFADREKFIYKAISKIFEFVRNDPEKKCVDIGRIRSILVPLLRSKVWDAKGGLKAGKLIGDENQDSHKLAASSKKSSEAEGVVRLDAVVALLELMKLLPQTEFEAGIPSVATIILRGLPSKEMENRRAAREALRKCARAMGYGRLPWLLREIRGVLPRGGYHAAVAVFTGHSVVEAVVLGNALDQSRTNSIPCRSVEIELAKEILELVRIEDREWAMMQSKIEIGTNETTNAEDLPSQCIEAKRPKGHELLQLGAVCLSPEIVSSVILRSTYGLLNSLDIDITVDANNNDDEKAEPEIVQGGEGEISETDEDSDEDMVSKPAASSRKRKFSAQRSIRIRTESNRDKQLNAAYGKKFYTRVMSALTLIVQGILKNAKFSDTDRLSVSIQSLALSTDYIRSHSRISQFEESLFQKLIVPDFVFTIDQLGDEIESGGTNRSSAGSVSQAAKLRQRQKEATFLVQPGASTGRGHWVTEEWKRGKISNESSKQSGIDLKLIKVKALGMIGVSTLANFLNSADCSARMSDEILKVVGKFVSRTFCSGVNELFQVSAKLITILIRTIQQKNGREVFNAKALSLITRKLIGSLEQLHTGGNDLSFITMKTQKKSTLNETATTCSNLLLSLVAIDTNREWMKPDMIDTLGSHVVASLDKPQLQLSALVVLKQIIVGSKVKSAVVYDCMNKVGELITTASNEKVCGIAGTMYGKFLVDFSHTEKSLSLKLGALLKQAQSASTALGRSTALNTIYGFLRALSPRMLQDQFGEIIVVTLAARASSEDDAVCAEMLLQIVSAVLAKFPDRNRCSRLIDVICGWTESMSKYQFLFSSILVGSKLVEDELAQPDRVAQMILSVVRQLKHLTIVINDEEEEDAKRRLVETKGLINIVRASKSCISGVEESSLSIDKVRSYVLGHLLNNSNSMDPVVVVEILKLVNGLLLANYRNVFKNSCTDESVSVVEDQQIDSIEPWNVLMRVLRVLTDSQTEAVLEIATLAMKCIMGLLPLSDELELQSQFGNLSNHSGSVERDESSDESDVEVDESDLGLFRTRMSGVHENLEEPGKVCGGTMSRKLALLKKIRYEVRGLMADTRGSIIRLASMLKMTTALVLSTGADIEMNDGILEVSLEILVRLATVNKTAEDVSVEIPEINSLFELSVLRPVEQMGCLSKMANAALEAIERHFQTDSGYFTKVLTAVTTTINKTRRARKISLLNLTISNPAKAAAMKLTRSRMKNRKKQVSKKLGLKRLKGMIY